LIGTFETLFIAPNCLWDGLLGPEPGVYTSRRQPGSFPLHPIGLVRPQAIQVPLVIELLVVAIPFAFLGRFGIPFIASNAARVAEAAVVVCGQEVVGAVWSVAAALS